MPETVRGLWKQRKRWAQGGAEVLVKNVLSIWKWRLRYMWPLLLEFSLSAIWAFTFALTIVLWFLGLFFVMPENLRVLQIVPPGFTGLLLAIVCLAQFSISLLIERRYEPDLHKSLFWIIWYPMVFWMLTLFTTLVSLPKVMLRLNRQRARWTSPDRGIARRSS